MTREEFQRYWREEHAAPVQRHAETLHIRRYIQTHRPLGAVAPGDLELVTEPVAPLEDGQAPATPRES